MQLISKWGYDGSSGHSEYMQKPHTLKDNINNSNNEITVTVEVKVITVKMNQKHI